MKIGNQHTAKSIAQFLGCEVVGDSSRIVTGINEIHRVEEGDLVFVDHPKYYTKALQSAASFVLIDQRVDCPADKTLLISSQPFDDYNKLTRHFSPQRLPTTMTGENCQIADSAHLSPNCFIGNDVVIGENAIIHAGAYIGDRTVIEENVIIGPNTVIGHAAFYYKKKETRYASMHTCGFVHIEKNVEIGASCTIDAGVSSVTRIGEGTKVDNLVQIGHDCVIGKHCLFAAHVGIAGCVTVEDWVTLWGQVGVVSGVRIGTKAVVLGQSGVSKDLEGNTTYFGSPCEEARVKFRESAALRMLPTILDSLK